MRTYEVQLATLHQAIRRGVPPTDAEILELYRFDHRDADRDTAQLFHRRRLLDEERQEAALERERAEWLASVLPDDEPSAA